MRGHGEKYTRKRDEAISALLAHPTVPEAAAAAGVADSTLWRWMQRDDFQTDLRNAKRETSRRALERVQGAMVKAVSTLEAVMDDGEAPAASRVAAARCVLDVGVKVAEVQSLTERIEKLETAAEAAGRNPH